MPNGAASGVSTATTVFVAAALSTGSNANNAQELTEQFLRRALNWIGQIPADAIVRWPNCYSA